MRVYPNRTPLGKGLDKLLHAGGCVALHLVGNMAVDVHREGGRGVAERFGNGLDVRAVLDGEGCEGVPLRYNYDKPEKPRISRVFGYLARFFILFQTEKSSREVIIS